MPISPSNSISFLQSSSFHPPLTNLPIFQCVQVSLIVSKPNSAPLFLPLPRSIFIPALIPPLLPNSQLSATPSLIPILPSLPHLPIPSTPPTLPSAPPSRLPSKPCRPPLVLPVRLRSLSLPRSHPYVVSSSSFPPRPFLPSFKHRHTHRHTHARTRTHLLYLQFVPF